MPKEEMDRLKMLKLYLDQCILIWKHDVTFTPVCLSINLVGIYETIWTLISV